MYATNFDNLTYSPANRKCKVTIQADETPETFPTDGSGVTNMPDDVEFEVGSSLAVVSTDDVFFCGEDSAWHPTANKK